MCNNCGIVAAFNLSEENKPVEGSISKTDVEGLEGDEFAVYEHFSKEVRIIKSGESIEVRLADNDDFKLYIIVPLINGSGVIGRIDKFISPKTVKYNRKGEAELIEDGPCAYIKNRKLVIEN
jgi:raffinose synthase